MERGRHEDERSSRLSGLWAVAMAVFWYYNGSDDPTYALLLRFRCCRVLSMAMVGLSLLTNQSGTAKSVQSIAQATRTIAGGWRILKMAALLL